LSSSKKVYARKTAVHRNYCCKLTRFTLLGIVVIAGKRWKDHHAPLSDIIRNFVGEEGMIDSEESELISYLRTKRDPLVRIPCQ